MEIGYKLSSTCLRLKDVCAGLGVVGVEREIEVEAEVEVKRGGGEKIKRTRAQEAVNMSIISDQIAGPTVNGGSWLADVRRGGEAHSCWRVHAN